MVQRTEAILRGARDLQRRDNWMVHFETGGWASVQVDIRWTQEWENLCEVCESS